MNAFALQKHIRRYLERSEIPYSFDDEEAVFYLDPPDLGDESLVEDPVVLTALVVRDELLHCYSSYTFNIEQEDLPLAAEFILRVNPCLPRGSFQLDWEDGEVRFFTYLDCPDDMKAPTDSQLEDLILFPLLMLGLYLEPLCSVLDRELSPKAALEQLDSEVSTDIN